MEDQKRDGKMKSMTSSNKITTRQRLMKLVKEGFKTTTCGSALQLTGKNGLDLKKSTYCKMQNDRKAKVVIEQSGSSSSAAVKSEVIPNCCESSSSTRIQNIAMVTAVSVQRSRTR